MTNFSQNDYPVLTQSQTFRWDLPLKETTKRHLILAPGDLGFVLAHFALWYHERVESLLGGVWDEWGWAVRPIRNSNETSNHASGTAMDLNAVKHPLGVVGTLQFFIFNKKRTKRELATKRLDRVLARNYDGVIRGGYTYQNRKDAMHYEINKPRSAVALLARRLRKTLRGKRIIKANPGYRF